MATAVDLSDSETATAAESQAPIRRAPWSILTESVALLVSPVVLFYALRMRPMAPNDLPDPGIHAAYIVHPRDMFMRYFAALTPTARMREGYRIGFLAPARLSYQLFGAIPGFYVTRYLFALIAIVPTYVLLRRLYGRPAGALAVIIVLSSPVFITAWGTDFPDSALISYAIGALACLAMPSKRRGIWVALAAALYAVGVWTFGVGIFLAVAAGAGFVGVGLFRYRTRLVARSVVFAASALLVTVVLMIVSENMFGRFDFILPTVRSARFLSQPSQVRLWHSATARWAPYLAFLLVPPAVLAAWVVVFVRRRPRIPTPQLTVAVVFGLQLAAYIGAQFAGHVQTLEQHYFSSTLWSGVCLTLAITLAELARPLFAAPRSTRWLPAALLLAIPLVYEIHPHVPAFGWAPVGYLLAAVLVVAASVPRLRRFAGSREVWVSLSAIGVISACALVLTVAPVPAHHRLPGSSIGADPDPAYAAALGGKAGLQLAQYRVETALPAFVRPATHKNENLLLWWNHGSALLGPAAAQYHTNFNSIRGPGPPKLPVFSQQSLDTRRPEEVLLLAATAHVFPAAVDALRRAGYEPVVLRKTVLRSGPVVASVWLIRLRAFPRRAP